MSNPLRENDCVDPKRLSHSLAWQSFPHQRPITMPRVKLEGDVRATELANVPSWTFQSGDNKPDSIFKKFSFKDFVTAFGFMSQVALVAEKVWPCPNSLNLTIMDSFSLTMN